MKKSLSILLALILVLCACPVFATAESAYQEAPALAAKVASGELPAVEERLPSEPQVIEVAEVGAYGGTWRQAVITGNFNHAHSHLVGYLETNGIIYDRDNTTITTSWLKEFSYNEDYTEFTFTLREGLKWSDGVPVTTEDVAFWFNDVVMNEDLTPTNTYYGDATLEVIDDYSWKLTFAAAKPMYLSYWAYHGHSRFVYPKHYLTAFHAAYNTEEELAATMAAEGFDDWKTMFEDKINVQKNVDLPVLGAWVMTADPAVTNTITFERNPYYWAVDQEGNQLPYIDSAVITVVESTDLMNMKVISGEVDVQVAGVSESLSNYPMFAQYAEEMNYTIATSAFNEPNAMNFHINTTSVDEVKAPYLSSVDFRRALSLGLDRQTIIDTFYTVGPFKSEIAQTAFLPGSPYYDEEWAKQYTEFDAETANAMLDELGMTEYGENGYRKTANGEDFALVILCPSYDAQWIEIAEMVASQWRENLHLDITATEVDPSLWNERMSANDFDITNLTGSNGMLALSSGFVADWTGYSGFGWGIRFMAGMYNDSYTGDQTETLTHLQELGTTITTETDMAARDEEIKELIQIWKDGLYSLGIGTRLPAINIIKNNFHNVSGLDQDWSFGYCGSSRGDTYWVEQ